MILTCLYCTSDFQMKQKDQINLLRLIAFTKSGDMCSTLIDISLARVTESHLSSCLLPCVNLHCPVADHVMVTTENSEIHMYTQVSGNCNTVTIRRLAKEIVTATCALPTGEYRGKLVPPEGRIDCKYGKQGALITSTSMDDIIVACEIDSIQGPHRGEVLVTFVVVCVTLCLCGPFTLG